MYTHTYIYMNVLTLARLLKTPLILVPSACMPVSPL